MKNIQTILLFTLVQVVTFSQVPASWNSRGIGGGGALFSPSINPSNHSDIYMSSDMSELFHSTDLGQNWSEVNFLKITGGHDACVQFTTDPSILFVVDYTSVAGSDYIRPMKSTDGGTTWNLLAGNPYPWTPNGNILRLFADYNDASHLVIADYGTIYFSGDGGTSFHKIHDCISNDAGNHIAGVFFDGQKVYIGTNDGLLVSSDGGQNFSTMSATGIPSSEKMLSFTAAKQNSTLRFFCLTATNVWSGYQYGSNYWNAMKGIYLMDNANGTWIQKTTGITFGSDFPVFIGMASNNTETVYIAGGSAAGNPIVMKSSGTGNWSHVFLTLNNQNIFTGWSGYGGDHGWSFPEAPFGFTVALNDASTVMFTDYSCAHITTDGGATWHQQYLSPSDENPMGSATPTGKKYHGIGAENASCWQIVWRDSLNMLAGFSDINGIMSDDKGESWKFIPGLNQNTVYRIVRHSNGNIYAAASSIHDMFQSTRIYDAQIDAGTGAIYFSTDNGNSFSLLHNFNHPVVWISLDPTNPERMYASVLHSNKSSTGGIYMTSNLGSGNSSAWVKMSNPPRSNGHPFNINVLNNGDLVASYSARKPKTSTPFTDSSGVYYYTAGTSTWHDRSDPNMRFWTQDVVVDPNDPSQNTWYACVFTGWGTSGISGTGGLYKTSNKGVSWTRINDNFRVNSCTINPSDPDELYFTTEIDGLWHCSDATSESPGFSQVQTYPFRHPMRVYFNPFHPSEVWVTSFGNGIKVGGNGSPSWIIGSSQKNDNAISISPNPFETTIRVTITNYQEAGEYSFHLFDLTGKELIRSLLQHETLLDLNQENYRQGIYLYEIYRSGKIIHQGKLIKL